MLELEELKKARKRGNVTTNELACILGFSNRSSYWRFERGLIKRVNIHRLPDLADKLQLNDNQILRIFFRRDVAKKETINK